MAALALLRPLPLLRLRLNHHRVAAAILIPLRRPSHSFPADSTCSGSAESVSSSGPAAVTEALRVKEAPKYHRIDDPEYRKWKDKEEKILRDVEAITVLIKEILHSDRYVDGERLSVEDERAVVEKLLAYHPHAEDKIGCGLDSIMVDRHPQFRHSRCLFVVRTDGGWIDFSYQKCLRDYIRNKYPSHAERFIREHLKRGSG